MTVPIAQQIAANDARVSAYLAVQHDDPDLAILVFYLSAAPLRLA